MINVLVTGRGGQVGSAVADELMGRVKLIGSRARIARPRRSGRHPPARSPRAPRRDRQCGRLHRRGPAESDESAAHAVNAVAPGRARRGSQARRCAADPLLHRLRLRRLQAHAVRGGRRGESGRASTGAPSSTASARSRPAVAATSRCARAGCTARTARTSCSRCCASRKRATSCAWSTTSAERRLRAARSRAWCARSSIVARAAELTRAQVDRLAEASGLYHATAAGETTWFGFAQAIFESAAKRNASLKAPARGADRDARISDAGEAARLLGAVERAAREAGRGDPRLARRPRGRYGSPIPRLSA